jgi:hypothetical protein
MNAGFCIGFEVSLPAAPAIIVGKYNCGSQGGYEKIKIRYSDLLYAMDPLR